MIGHDSGKHGAWYEEGYVILQLLRLLNGGLVVLLTTLYCLARCNQPAKPTASGRATSQVSKGT